MCTGKIKELIESSDLSELHKKVSVGFINRAEADHDRMVADKNLIEIIANEHNASEIILSTDDVTIYTVKGKNEWDIKYPYRVIYRDSKGSWQRIATVSPSLDIAYLVYLETKYDGLNSQFAKFACKMLGI